MYAWYTCIHGTQSTLGMRSTCVRLVRMLRFVGRKLSVLREVRGKLGTQRTRGTQRTLGTCRIEN